MTEYINLHYINASRLIMLSAIISVCGFILLGNFTNPDNLYYMASELIITVGLAFFIRRQHNWARWVFLIVSIYGLYNVISMLGLINILLPVIGVAGYTLAALRVCIEVAAVVFLFVKPKQPTAELAEPNATEPFDSLDE